MTSIHMRPTEVEDRLVPGHWEGDLIKGAGNRSSVGTLIERTSRVVMLAYMEDATAEGCLAAFTPTLNRAPTSMRKTLTYDQGKEMARHQDLTIATGVNVYFADPHSPWQRGSNENTNGLLRQYLPKGEDLSTYPQRELDVIARPHLEGVPAARHAPSLRKITSEYGSRARLTFDQVPLR